MRHGLCDTIKEALKHQWGTQSKKHVTPPATCCKHTCQPSSHDNWTTWSTSTQARSACLSAPVISTYLIFSQTGVLPGQASTSSFVRSTARVAPLLDPASQQAHAPPNSSRRELEPETRSLQHGQGQGPLSHPGTNASTNTPCPLM
jgi:hypothetical protein